MFNALHHLLRDNAKKYYLDNIEDTCLTYRDACQKMEKVYNSTSRQNRIGNMIKHLRLSNFKTPDRSLSEAFEILQAKISNLIPQGPAHNRSEGNKIEYLKTAAQSPTWATPVISRANGGILSYEEFV